MNASERGPARWIIDPPRLGVENAVEAVLAGRIPQAEMALRSIDSRTLGYQRNAVKIAGREIESDHGATLPEDERILGGIDRGTAMQLFQRDRFTCRYCGKPTIFLPVLAALSSPLPEILRWSPNWKGAHPIFWTHGATVEHMRPRSRGGTNEFDANLRTACYLQQQVKADRLMSELGWTDLPIEDSTWSGLSDRYPELCDVLGLHDIPYHRDWLRLC